MLDQLALKYGTDKASNYHNYTGIYEHYLSSFKDWELTLIEVGYGGYEYPDRGGESARMWNEYFQNGKIVSIDIHEKENAIGERREFWQGSATDENLLKSIFEREAGAKKRIFIDDASHSAIPTIRTFEIVFPLLKSGDLYFVEDVQTSYWKDYYDGNEKPGEGVTAMNYFTFLCHQLNSDVLKDEYKNGFAGKIEFIHFYKELIVIKHI